MHSKLMKTFIGVGSILALTLMPSYALKDTKKEVVEKESNLYTQLNLFGEVFERVKESYVEDVDNKELIEAAINGMLVSLDPHSSYLNAKNFQDMRIQTRGEFGGLGIEVTMEAGFVKVVSPIDDTPAAKAGIMAGDFITRLDDKQVLGMTLQEAVDLMRGKVGEPIKITVHREGSREPLEFDITRDKIEIRAVRAREYNNVGYIRITTFNENTYTDLEKAMNDIQDDLGEDLKGFVLDLRNNPGGLLDQAIAVSDAFLDQGEIVSTRSRDDKNIKRFFAEKGDLSNGKSLVILINSGSASASEIVSGALKEHKRALLVGTKSFGKGSVQSVMPLASGDGALRLTTARYYTPSGTSIQATGIEPDVVIENGEIKVKENAYELSEKSLPGHLVNERAKQEREKEKKDKLEKSKNGIKYIDEEALTKDTQLKYALDLLGVMPIIHNIYTKKDDINKSKKTSDTIESKKAPAPEKK